MGIPGTVSEDGKRILKAPNINILSEIIAWATNDDGAKVKVEKSSFSGSIAANLLWLSSDGTTSISDEEVVVILSYAERYPGFKEVWETVFNPLDNELTDDEISKMIEALAQDKTYTSILKWMLEENSLNISLANWLYIIDEESEYYDAGYVEVTNGMITDLAEKTNLPKGFLTDIKNGNYVNDKQIEIISNDEDRLIVYYVLANHPEKYSTFITEWQTYTARQNSVASNVKKNGWK